MLGELYSILTAVLWGFAVIPTRKGLENSNPSTSVFIYLILNTVVLWLVTFTAYPLSQISMDGIEFFVIAGTTAPGIATIFQNLGINKLGVTLTSPIVGTSTFFAMLFAALFLGEKVTIALVLGAILIFIGINVLTHRSKSEKKWKKVDLVFPLLAAIFYAFSINLRKFGLLENGIPIMGAAVTSSVSLLILCFSIIFSRFREKGNALIFNRESLKFFTVAAVAQIAAFILYFTALSSSNIVKIQPITASNSLFAILFSYIYLKDVEIISRKIVIGAILIVLGIAFVFF